MVEKKYRFGKLLRKVFGMILISLCLFLAFKSIDKYRNYVGIFLSINCIVLASSLTKVFLPEPPKKIKNK